MARRLQRWGARPASCPTRRSPRAPAGAGLGARCWSTMRSARDACDALAQRRGEHAAPDRAGDAGERARACRRSSEAGFTGYLVKPVRAASLAARLRGADELSSRAGDDASELPATTHRQRDRNGLSILVAEDNEINALLTRALLATARPSSDHRGNGDAAVEAWLAARAAGTPYDLVLMDVHMPGIDGIEATRRIRAAEAGSGARARRSSRSPPMRSTRIARPASPPAWTAS